MDTRTRLLKKIVEPDNIGRIGEWINWCALMELHPDNYKVHRVGLDFVLMLRDPYPPHDWMVIAICEPMVESKLERTSLRII